MTIKNVMTIAKTNVIKIVITLTIVITIVITKAI